MLLPKSIVGSLLISSCSVYANSNLGVNEQIFLLDHQDQQDFGPLDFEPRLIMTNNEEILLVTEQDKLGLKLDGVTFKDVTNYWQEFIDSETDDFLQISKILNHYKQKEFDNYQISIESLSSNKFNILEDKKGSPILPVYDYPIDNSSFHFGKVEKLINKIDTEKMYSDLSVLTGFYSRYYKSNYGLESALWVYGELLALATDNAKLYNVTLFEHEDFPQPSIIFKILGNPVSNSTSNDHTNESEPIPKIVVGCHLDSINLIMPNFLKAPGADDNGSGVVTVLEALRLIVKNNLTFKNDVEFHFYAAEEGGLLGSAEVMKDYKDANAKIVAMLQQDMTGYTKKSLDKGFVEHFGLVTDHISLNLNDFLKLIIDNYCSIPYLETKCGYSCSDHSSALDNGFPSAFIFESQFELHNPYIHTVFDTIEKLNFLHIAEHVKLILGFVVELGNHKEF
ncbi:hypothetical protein BVG19_g3417 [[Candida] boidinii]|nr:hypothetical protein BVG19_g3417 [[Candida] boidinii]OWB53865.1 hydrolase activity protein [[Candida] boidinii]OWB86687.1 hydrolase activity protein [[Candida] boidinii]